MSRNYEPCLFEVSDDWRERWALIREFATKWYGVHFRSRESLLPLVKYEEERLGFKLPPSFQEYIMFHACANQALPGFQELKCFQKLSTITFHCWCERDVFSTIDVEDLDIDDPPIQEYLLTDEYLRDTSLAVNYHKYIEGEPLFCKKKNQMGSLSSYVFWLIFQYNDYVSNSGGSLSVSINNNEQFIPMMNNFFERKTIIDSQIVYEKQNIISVVNHLEDPKYPKYFYRLFISLWQPLYKEEIPQFILQLIGNSGHYTGLFRDIFDEISNSRKDTPNKFNILEDSKNEDTGLDPIPF